MIVLVLVLFYFLVGVLVSIMAYQNTVRTDKIEFNEAVLGVICSTLLWPLLVYKILS